MGLWEIRLPIIYYILFPLALYVFIYEYKTAPPRGVVFNLDKYLFESADLRELACNRQSDEVEASNRSLELVLMEH